MRWPSGIRALALWHFHAPALGPLVTDKSQNLKARNGVSR